MTRMSAAICCLAALVLTGCAGLSGTWNMREFVPESARGDFDFDSIRFTSEDHFTATATYGGQQRELSGLYDFDEEAETITFKGENMPPRTYRIELCAECGMMRIMDPGKPRKWTAVFKRR